MGVGEYQGRQVQGSCDPPPSEGLLVGKGQSDSILKAILRGKKAIWGAVSQVSCFSFFFCFYILAVLFYLPLVSKQDMFQFLCFEQI